MAISTGDPSKSKLEILKITEQCVRCGMCLPHCPTSKLTNLEGHSPRGRIALWQSLALNKLDLTNKTIEYLSHCLSCGACANNCPAGVDYLKLQDMGLGFINNNKSLLKPTDKIILRVFSSKHLTSLVHYCLYLIQKLRMKVILNQVLKPFPKINQLFQILPEIRLNTIENRNLENHSDTVILFIGCVNKIVNYNKIKASVELLNKLNIKAIILENLHCCGALCKHNGFNSLYEKISNNNKQLIRRLFSLSKIEMLTLDTGCHRDIHEQFKEMDYIQVINIEQYLYKKLPINYKLDIKTKIYIHNPCSQVEQLKQPNLIYELLSLVVPKENLITLGRGYGCCGAAGNFMLKHPKTANKLGQKILDDFLQTSPSITTIPEIIIITSNVGCMLHLKKLLTTEYKLHIEIITAIELINRFFDLKN